MINENFWLLIRQKYAVFSSYLCVFVSIIEKVKRVRNKRETRMEKNFEQSRFNIDRVELSYVM